MLVGRSQPVKCCTLSVRGGHKLIHATENKKNVLLLNFRLIFSSRFSDLRVFFLVKCWIVLPLGASNFR